MSPAPFGVALASVDRASIEGLGHGTPEIQMLFGRPRSLFLVIGAVAAVGLGCIYIAPPGSARTLADIGFGVVAVLLLRQAFVSGAMQNPFGDARDFSPGPAMKDLLIGAAFALAAITWAKGSAVAVRAHLLPDTPLPVYSVALVPLFLLFGAFVFFLGRATFRAMFGRASSRV